jgi:hypothetical protein
VVAPLFLERDYELFGMLAGVREEDLVMFSPRGFPEDAGHDTRYQYVQEMSDAHSESWLSSEEIRQVEARKEWSGNESLFALMKALPDARLVFWFDS